MPLPRREDLDADAQRVFDEMANPSGGTLRGLRGPGGIYLNSPKVATLLRPLNDYLRTRSGIPGRIREIAILTTARVCNSQFEWAAHEAEALRQGVPAAVIEVIKRRMPTSGLDAADGLTIDLCRASFETRHVSSELYARAIKQFGKQQFVDLVILMGYYAMTAGLLTSVDMQLDRGVDPPLPMP
jgi:4-carboxymuconolactone decarboxylase